MFFRSKADGVWARRREREKQGRTHWRVGISRNYKGQHGTSALCAEQGPSTARRAWPIIDSPLQRPRWRRHGARRWDFRSVRIYGRVACGVGCGCHSHPKGDEGTVMIERRGRDNIYVMFYSCNTVGCCALTHRMIRSFFQVHRPELFDCTVIHKTSPPFPPPLTE